MFLSCPGVNQVGTPEKVSVGGQVHLETDVTLCCANTMGTKAVQLLFFELNPPSPTTVDCKGRWIVIGDSTLQYVVLNSMNKIFLLLM